MKTRTWRKNWKSISVSMGLVAILSVFPIAAMAAGTGAQASEQEAETAEAGDVSELPGEAQDVVLSTDYPGVTAKPGATVTFPLYIVNNSDDQANVELTAEDLPEGWSGYFRGSDSEVSSVHVGARQEKADSPKLSYALTVPDEAEDGEYELGIHASGDEMKAETTLHVRISREEAGQSDFTAEYPEQEGDSSTAFSFDTTIVNNRVTPQSYSLSAKAPEGWTVSFTPSGESSKVASLPVDAGKSQGLKVDVKPSETVEKGDYTVSLAAISAEDTLNLDLQITITGTYDVTFTTPTGNLSASAFAGEEAKVTMAVTNSGNVDLENLQLSAKGATDWNISFDETTIPMLEAGATKEVTAVIQPAKNAVIGDYVTVMNVSNSQVKGEADLRISVKTHTTWGLTAVAVIAVVIICLGLVIHRYGRR